MSDTPEKSPLQRLAHYRIEAFLGEGAYAEVYRAVDERMGRTVALKVLKPIMVTDADALRRFLQEARLAGDLFHQRLAVVLDAGEDGGHYYLAMRFVDGSNLAQFLAERGPLPWEEALRLTRQIAEGLTALHERGLVHRDLKPQNILLEKGKDVVLTDFGLARALHASGLSTKSSAFVGTPAYIPPEVWEGQKATPAADQYALACIVAEMLTGQVLYDGPTTPAVMRKHFAPPPLPAQWPQGVPAGLNDVLRKALAQDPAERYPDVMAFVEALEGLGVTSEAPIEKEKTAPSRQVEPRASAARPAPAAAVLGERQREKPTATLHQASSGKETKPASQPKAVWWGMGLLALIVVVLMVWGGQGSENSISCSDPYGCITVGADEPITIGVAMVLSGPNESLGVDEVGGVEIAVNDFIAANRDWLGKHAIEVVKEDSQCSAEGGLTAAQKLAADKSIVGVIGTSCSSAGEPASKILSDAHIVMISPSNTAPSLTDPKTHAECYLRTSLNDRVQGEAVAEFAYNVVGARTMATIHDGSPYAEQLQQVACDVFTQLGGQCVAQEAINVGDTDMRPVLTKIAAAKPDVLYYPIFIQEGALITQQAKEVPGLEKTVLMGSDGMISPDFIKVAGKAAEGMYLSGPAAVNNAEFNKKYEAKYGQEPPSAFHLHAYDATMMLLDAIKKVAVVDKDGTIYIPRKVLCEALFSTKDFEGLTGTLTCDQYGDCAYPNINIYQIQNGKYVPVWQWHGYFGVQLGD